jgi:hypothetical protein
MVWKATTAAWISVTLAVAAKHHYHCKQNIMEPINAIFFILTTS